MEFLVKIDSFQLFSLESLIPPSNLCNQHRNGNQNSWGWLGAGCGQFLGMPSNSEYSVSLTFIWAWWWSWQLYHMQRERCKIQLVRGVLKKGHKFYLQKTSCHVPSYILYFSLQRSRTCFLHNFRQVFVEPNSSWVSGSTLTVPEGWTPAHLSQAAQILFSSQWANVQQKRWNFGSAVRVTSELKPWKKHFFYF